MEFILPSVLGAIAATILGMLWYSPKMFGTTWMSLSGMSHERINNPTNGLPAHVGMIIGFAVSIAKVAALAGIIFVLAPATLMQALLIAVFVWAGFFMTNDIRAVLWEMQSWKLFLIHTLYNLVMLLISATIIFYI